MANVQKQAQTSTQQHVPADVGAIVRERDALYKELQSAKAVVEVMEDTLDYRQKELERQEGKRKKAEQQSQVYKTDMEKCKAEVAQLKQNTEKRTAQLQKKLAERQQGEQTALKQLEDARNHIFRLQPRRTDITEIEANELFNDLFNNIQRWVANRLEKILDMQEDGRLRGRAFPREAARKVLQLTSARGMQSNKWDGSDEFQIIAVIMRFLCRSFFDRIFYCPLTAEGQQNINDTTTIVSRVEQLMKALPRDGSQCRHWRVEALLALTQEHGFAERRALYEDSTTTELFNFLVPLVPGAEPQDLSDSIRRNMIKPAMELAHRLQLAATMFTLRWTSFDGNSSSGQVNSSTIDFSRFVSMSITHSGKVIVPPAPAATAGQQAPGVEYLFDVAPGLFSKSPDDADAAVGKVISKPRVMVYAPNESGTGPKPGFTLMKWIEEESKREARPTRDAPRVHGTAGGNEATAKLSMRNTITSLNKRLRK